MRTQHAPEVSGGQRTHQRKRGSPCCSLSTLWWCAALSVALLQGSAWPALPSLQVLPLCAWGWLLPAPAALPARAPKVCTCCTGIGAAGLAGGRHKLSNHVDAAACQPASSTRVASQKSCLRLRRAKQPAMLPKSLAVVQERLEVHGVSHGPQGWGVRSAMLQTLFQWSKSKWRCGVYTMVVGHGIPPGAHPGALCLPSLRSTRRSEAKA